MIADATGVAELLPALWAGFIGNTVIAAVGCAARARRDLPGPVNHAEILKAPLYRDEMCLTYLTHLTTPVRIVGA